MATGADEYRTGTTMDDYLDEIRGLDLGGKPVAVFGCGDSQGYGDNFCDAIEEMHGAFKEAGGKMLGYVDSSAYQHSESKSDVGGKFLGLPLDQDNEGDMTPERVDAWVSQLRRGRRVTETAAGQVSKAMPFASCDGAELVLSGHLASSQPDSLWTTFFSTSWQRGSRRESARAVQRAGVVGLTKG